MTPKHQRFQLKNNGGLWYPQELPHDLANNSTDRSIPTTDYSRNLQVVDPLHSMRQPMFGRSSHRDSPLLQWFLDQNS